MKKRRVFTCVKDDLIIHNGNRMSVAEIITRGREKCKVKDKSGKMLDRPGIMADISAYPIMSDNGQILTRSPRCIGQEWSHI